MWVDSIGGYVRTSVETRRGAVREMTATFLGISEDVAGLKEREGGVAGSAEGEEGAAVAEERERLLGDHAEGFPATTRPRTPAASTPGRTRTPSG